MHGQIGRKWIIGGALILIGGLMANTALAAIFETCVQSDSDLTDALDTARSQPVKAKIVQHNLTAQHKAYDLKNTVWQTGFPGIQGGSQLLGGYTAACASRDIAAGNTLIVDSAALPFAAFQGRGSLTVEGLTFNLLNGLGVGLGSGSYLKVPSGSTIEFRRDAFLNTAGNGLTIVWDQATDSDSTIRIVDTLIANNTSIACALFLEADSGAPEFDVINNTVFNNAGPGASGACFFDIGANGTFQAFNNIFWGTGGASSVDLTTNTSLVVLDHNIFNSRVGPAPITTSGNLFSDPTLDVNYRPIEVPQSNAINSGNNSVPGDLPTSDLDGGPRIVGSIVDRGAYESSIDPHAAQTVMKTVDDGSAGTLRAAIHSVNSNGGGTIKFAIATGSCPHVITVSSALGEFEPLIVNATIDGYLQNADAKPNDLDPGDDAVICVILEAGTGVGAPARGLVVGSAAPDGTSVTIRGIGFSGFSTTGVDLQGGSGHTIVGNHFGGSIGGHAMQPNGFAIRLGDTGTHHTHNDAIGSSAFADRNIIGDTVNSGVVIYSGSKNNQVSGNYIGMGWNTVTSAYINRGNGARGIYLAGDSNTISGNLIGFNAQAGIVLDSLGAQGNLISHNFIGADFAGTNVGNIGAGIHLIGDNGVTGDAPNGNTIRSNTIADNGAQGVLIDVGQGNLVRKNSIYSNVALGIDLGAVGISANNDDGGVNLPDTANRLQNFPVLTAAAGGNQSGTVTGSLTTTAGDYTIDFYNSPGCDTSGNGEGKSWLGGESITVIVPVGIHQGTNNFNLPISAPLFLTFADGSKITATATDVNGNTSEFSACVNYLNDTIFTDGFEGPPPQF